MTYITGYKITVLKNQGGVKKAIFWLIMVSISITFNYLIFLPLVCLVKTKLLLTYGPFHPRKFSFNSKNFLFQFFITETDRAIYKELKEVIKNNNSDDNKVMTSIFELENDLDFLNYNNEKNNNNYNNNNLINNYNDEEEDLLNKNTNSNKNLVNVFNEHIDIIPHKQKIDSKNKISYNKITPFNENQIYDDYDFNNKNSFINKLNIEEIQTKLKNSNEQDEIQKKEFFEKNNENIDKHIISEPRISSEHNNDLNNSDYIFDEEVPVKMENYSKKNSGKNNASINNPDDDNISPMDSRIYSNHNIDKNNSNIHLNSPNENLADNYKKDVQDEEIRFTD